MRALISFIAQAALLAAACGTDSTVDLTAPDARAANADAGAGEGRDAGSADAGPTRPDASSVDAGTPDASTAAPDAGTPDAAPAPRGCDFAEPSCSGENICMANRCVSAWGRGYRVTIYSAEVPALTPQGNEWDVDGTAPDLYAAVVMDERWVYYTEIVEDDFTAEFVDASYVLGALWPSTILLFYVFDSDPTFTGGTSSEGAFVCVPTVTADLLDPSRGAGEVLCSTSAGDFHAKIEPL